MNFNLDLSVCMCVSGCVCVSLRVSGSLCVVGVSFRGYVKGIHNVIIVIIVLMVCFHLF